MTTSQSFIRTTQRITFVVGTMVITSALLAEGLPEDLEVVWSDPPNNHVDVGTDRDVDGKPLGISAVELVFNQGVDLAIESVELLSTAAVPAVVDVYGRGDYWTVVFDGPIAPGTTTILGIDGGRVLLAMHSRPADVNLDGVSDALDVDALQAVLTLSKQYAAHFDIDRDGVLAAADVVRLDEILSGADGGVAWARIDFPPPETARCCCVGGGCDVFAGGCPWGTTQTTCPCTPNPCGYGGG